MGSLFHVDRVPDQDSLPVERILGAGAVMLGKTNLPEFGMIGDTTNRLGGLVQETHGTRTAAQEAPRGGGAAALAAGLCAISQGSDGGGSIRGPSSFCGVYGIKPTLGQGSAAHRQGVQPLQPARPTGPERPGRGGHAPGTGSLGLTRPRLAP